MTCAARPRSAIIGIKHVTAAAAVALVVWLVWALRSLIVPASAAGLLAYICRPLVHRLERHRIPRGVAIGLLLLLFVAVGAASMVAVVSSESRLLELRVRALYGLDHRYQALMGLDRSWTRGNRLYEFASPDLDPLLDRLSDALALSPEERIRLVASFERAGGAASTSRDQMLQYDRCNVDLLALRARRRGAGRPEMGAGGGASHAAVPSTGETGTGARAILSTWLIAPLVFLFLLLDTGNIKRGLVRAVPNRLFEPTLAVLADVDQALGNYVRGVFLECCAVGLTVMLLMVVVGTGPRWAFAIGMLTAASNLIPYMGFAAALMSGLGCALLTDPVHPWIPFVTPETFPIWVMAAVVLSELLKNLVYEPIVLGGAVKLHPLGVVFATVGGAILFGPAGMFLAIPTITIGRALIASTLRNLSAYRLV